MVIGVWKGWEFMFLVERYPGLDFSFNGLGKKKGIGKVLEGLVWENARISYYILPRCLWVSFMYANKIFNRPSKTVSHDPPSEKKALLFSRAC
jgi:hypothetical protein